jgi:hypothetical protein
VLAGQTGPGTVYLGQRLLYEKARDLEQLDPFTSDRYWRELLKHAGLVCLTWLIGGFLITVAWVIFTLIAHGLGAVLGIVLGLAWFVLMACVFWMRRVPGQLSEWKFQVDGGAPAVAQVFDHIAWSLHRRATPADTVQLRRFQVPGQGTRDLLEIRQGIFYGLISCFPSGNDLYLGWTLWLYLSAARFLGLWIQRFFWELRFRGHAVYLSLQYDRAKALREALHGAVREGAEVAAGHAVPHGQGILGTVIPVVADDSLSQAPWAVFSQPPGWQPR